MGGVDGEIIRGGVSDREGAPTAGPLGELERKWRAAGLGELM